MCVMRWANGAILLKRLVHLSSTEHLVVLAEKKNRFGPYPCESQILVSPVFFSFGFRCWCLQPSACVKDSFTLTFKQLCDGWTLTSFCTLDWLYEKKMMSTSLLIVCVNFLQYLDQYGPPAHRKDQWNCYCDLQASLHQMCAMLWANGAILLKRPVR
jgi:hypothetical protein